MDNSTITIDMKDKLNGITYFSSILLKYTLFWPNIAAENLPDVKSIDFFILQIITPPPAPAKINKYQGKTNDSMNQKCPEIKVKL